MCPAVALTIYSYPSTHLPPYLGLKFCLNSHLVDIVFDTMLVFKWSKLTLTLRVMFVDFLCDTPLNLRMLTAMLIKSL